MCNNIVVQHNFIITQVDIKYKLKGNLEGKN